MPGYEHCAHCPHTWHGLACAELVWAYENHRAVRTTCACPSQWAEGKDLAPSAD